MKSHSKIIMFAVAAFLMTGCVTHKKYNRLLDDYNTSQVALAESKANAKSLESMLDQAKKENQELRNDYRALQGALDQSLASNQSGGLHLVGRQHAVPFGKL